MTTRLAKSKLRSRLTRISGFRKKEEFKKVLISIFKNQVQVNFSVDHS